jgi:signal peptidase I
MEANEIRQYPLIADLPAPGPSLLDEEEVAIGSVAGEAAPPPIAVAAAKPLWRDWVETLLTTILIFIIVENFVCQGFKVQGGCMEPNLFTGERLLGNKLAYHFHDVQRGDIIVFRPPQGYDTPFIKRVVALPGETVEIRDSQVYIDSKPLSEPYLRNQWRDNRPAERVPEGYLFVMGDNRNNSNDSRAWGDLPVKNVEAKAWLRYWPLRRVEVLR